MSKVLSMIPLMLLVVTVINVGVSADDRVVESLFDSQLLSRNVTAIRARAAAMSDEERFDFLTEWVLPSNSHSTIRMAAGIVDQRPPISPNGETQTSTARKPVVSPVLDLLNVAKKLRRMDELLKQVSSMAGNEDSMQQRAHTAMLALIHLQRGDLAKADKSIESLQSLLTGAVSQNSDPVWPETLVAWQGMRHHPTNPAVGDLVDQLNQVRVKRTHQTHSYRWNKLIETLWGKKNFLAAGGSVELFVTNAESKEWISAERIQAATSHMVRPEGGWVSDSNGGLKFHSQGVENFLLFRSPLRGNFELEAEIGSAGHTLVYVAGALLGPVKNEPRIRAGTYQSGIKSEPLTQAFQLPNEPWGRVRAVFRDDVCSVYLHGRLVRQIPISQNSFPWIGFHSAWRNAARVRNVAITGEPIVPDSVLLSGSKTLDGWLPYHSPSIGVKGAAWSWQQDAESTGMITGDRWSSTLGTWREQLLQYQRPLLAGGSVEYDFFYKPGESIVHPALGRLAFLLSPDGVKTHWATKSQHDRSEVSPDNILSEPSDSVRAASIPLKANAWNQVRVSVDASTVTVFVNQQPVYKRTLDLTNACSHNRQFGLFHYQGEENVRVRNVVMRGDWPKVVPEFARQELADSTVANLEQRVSKIKSVFEHDFAKNGLPEAYFKTMTNSDGHHQVRPGDGVLLGMTGSGAWSSQKLEIPFQMEGDFDVSVAFDQVRLTGTQTAHVLMQVAFDGKEQMRSRVSRMLNRNTNLILSSWSEQRNGTRIYADGLRASTELDSGTLRMIRIGKTVYTLFAQADSPVFQLVRQQDFNTGKTLPKSVELAVLCNGDDSASVNWKSIRIAAEKLTFYPTRQAGRTLHVLTLPKPGQLPTAGDPVRVRQVTDPVNGLRHLGSAEWSSDGKKIVCDMSMGGVGTSHIMLLNADGTGVKDLGTGAMPSLSPDGKEVVFSSPGIMKMNSDGTNRKSIGAGWGTQWSPDGRYIAWGSGRNITLVNTKTGETKSLLTPEQEQQIRSIYWNLGWSRNGKSIAFKALLSRGNNQTVVVADVDSSNGFKVVLSTEQRVNEDFTWHPDGRRVLFSMMDPATNTMRMVLVNRDTTDGPQPIHGIPTDWSVWDCAWSPDGKQILFSAEVPPEPVEWSATR